MIDFKILKKSQKSRARLGLLKTPNGEVETPAMVPVATQAVVKTLTSEDVLRTKSQILISNTFHLHLRPGEDVVRHAGGLHKFSKWPKPIMTDSGGFQVFSLGFGKDMGMTKILKKKASEEVKAGQQPRLLKISEEGVEFTSYLDGSKLSLSPESSIAIQESLGADIIFAFDECPPPNADRDYLETSIERTHRWAKRSLEARKGGQAIYGIVQGGKHEDLRRNSAQEIARMSFDGFGIGGEMGVDKDWMFRMIALVNDELPEDKPRHLLGNGYLEDIPKIAGSGADTFDCVVPTHHARHGTAFTSSGKLDLSKTIFLGQHKKLDPKCDCEVCETYTRSYISHLIRAREITGLKLLTFHNLYFWNEILRKVREDIKTGKL